MIEHIAKNTKGVKEVFEVKTRLFGHTIYTEVVVGVDKSLSVEQGHDIALVVHDNIEGKVDNIKHATVHIEPV